MCLLVLAWKAHSQFQLVVAANRDEFHDRPAAPLAKWNAPHEILAGRDLRARGTWLATDAKRRFGVVTNFRDLQPPRAGAPSRGALIPDYLAQMDGPEAFLTRLAPAAPQYSGFNLLLADGNALWYATNRASSFARALQPGAYGLSNQLLDTPWPKLSRVRGRFEHWLLRAHSTQPAADLFAMLDDREPAGRSGGVPSTTFEPALERALSAPFVQHPRFGTRCSTVLLLEPSGAMHLAERRFDASGELMGEESFTLRAGEWP